MPDTDTSADLVDVDGIAVRAADLPRYRARVARHAGTSTPAADTVDAQTAEPEATGGQQAYDPAEHTVDQVLEYLASADAGAADRVLDAEAAGKNRKTILDQRNQPHTDALLPSAD